MNLMKVSLCSSLLSIFMNHNPNAVEDITLLRVGEKGDGFSDVLSRKRS